MNINYQNFAFTFGNPPFIFLRTPLDDQEIWWTMNESARGGARSCFILHAFMCCNHLSLVVTSLKVIAEIFAYLKANSTWLSIGFLCLARLYGVI